MKRLLIFLVLLVFAVPCFAGDISVTAGNVVKDANAVIVKGTAGATVTAGEVVYADTSDNGDYKLADCDLSAAASVVAGIAMNGAADGQPLSVQIAGDITIGGTVVVGEIYVLSGTAGGVAIEGDLAQNDYVSVIGVGVSATVIRINRANSGVQVP